MKHFKIFTDGEVVSDAGVRIIRLVVWEPSMERTRYVVEMTCCGVRRLMTHAYVRKRGKRKRAGVPRKCSNCRGKPKPKPKPKTKAIPEQCSSNVRAFQRRSSAGKKGNAARWEESAPVEDRSQRRCDHDGIPMRSK